MQSFILTIQILDSKFAPKFTLENITLSEVYQNETSFNCKIGGDKGSVSGNRNTTSTSFSIGFNSGLNKYKKY